MKLKFILASMLITPSISYAFFCPTNFNQINFGDTTDQVKTSCGKPDKEEKKDAEASVPQEWTYYVPQTVSMGTSQQAQGTLKTSVAFDKDGKAINISVNGLGVGESTICGVPIQLGSTKDQIKTACGDPSSVVKQSNDASGNQEPPKQIVTFTYNSTPPQKLIFENDKLVKKE